MSEVLIFICCASVSSRSKYYHFVIRNKLSSCGNSWIQDFYSLEEVEFDNGEQLDSELIQRNNKKNIKDGLNLWVQLPLLIREVNSFLDVQRDKLIDKVNLDEKRKNIKVLTPNYKTEEEMLEKFKSLDYSNEYYQITKSFIRLKLNTSYLANPKNLLEIEDKLNLQLTKIKKSIKFLPVKPFKEGSDDYNKMLKEYEDIPYTLIDNFQVIWEKSNFYLQMNYTGNYKKTVIFPQSKTIRQILTEKDGTKIEKLLEGVKFILGKS